MNFKPPCFLYTQDAALERSLHAYLDGTASLRHIDDARSVEVTVQQFNPTVLLFDLRAKGSATLLPRILQAMPETVLIALGEPDSEPFLEADAMGAYAVEDYAVKRQRLETIVARALDHAAMVQENRVLKSEMPAADPTPGLAPPPRGPGAHPDSDPAFFAGIPPHRRC